MCTSDLPRLMLSSLRPVLSAAVIVTLASTASAQTAPSDPALPPAARAAPAPAADPPADPAPPAPEIAPFFKGTEVGAYIDANYDWFSTRPQGDALYRNFDTRQNQFRVGMAQVWLSKAPTADSRAGYRIKLSGGPASTMVQSYEPGSTPALQNIEEGFISYLMPVGKGLQFDVGKFVTQHGAEVIEAKDDWNYSRSLLFALAIPYYHAGVRASYAPNDKVSVMATLVNGWNNVSENNTGKTFGLQLQLKPTARFSLTQNYMAGPEQPNDNTDWRHLADTTATYTLSPKFSLMGNYDYGSDTYAGVPVHWQGLAGYLKFQPVTWLALSPRYEIYDDPQGFTTGSSQRLREVTGTMELKATDTFLWRIEYRRDVSSQSVFKRSAGDWRNTQSSIGFGVLYSFSLKG